MTENKAIDKNGVVLKEGMWVIPSCSSYIKKVKSIVWIGKSCQLIFYDDDSSGTENSGDYDICELCEAVEVFSFGVFENR